MVNSIKIPLLRATYSGQSYISDADTVLSELSELIPDLEPGATITLKVVSLTAAEYVALPEFNGW